MPVRDFVLPDLGEGLEEGEIVAWLVEVGDAVALNQAVASIETAKAVIDVPSPFAGTVAETVGAVGDTLPVGSVLLRVETATPADGDAGEATASPSVALDVARRGEDTDEQGPQPLVGYGATGAAPRRRRTFGRGADRAAGAGASVGSPPVLAAPPVRKLARDRDIDLAALAPGSGDGGIITREDVLTALQGTDVPAEPQMPGRPVLGTEAPVPAIGFRGRRPGEVETVRGIRKRIVEKMEMSRREIPSATCSRQADLTALWDARTTLTEQAQADGATVRITPFVLVMRATILALRRFPTLNARIDREAGEIRLLEPIHLGFAADTDRGLMVPNIRDAHSRSTLELASEVSRLAGGARDGTVTPAELTGGTFTVNNYGAFGNDDADPIINHPEGAILGVGAIRPRPWVVDGQLAVRRVATFRLAFDHRICDGGEAGRFVTYVAELCEDPVRLLLHA